MAKYMRNGRDSAKMEMKFQGFEDGVKTRARALAMALQQQHFQEQYHKRSIIDRPQDARNSTESQPYMELRSRRLEKVVKCREQLAVLASVDVPQIPDHAQCQSCVNESVRDYPVVPSRSSQTISDAISVKESGSLDMLTLSQNAGLARQEAACREEIQDKGTSTISCELHTKVEFGSGESPLLSESFPVASCSLQSQTGRLPRSREATPESFFHELEPRGSTSRRWQPRLVTALLPDGSNEQTVREVEHFFASVERQERRRFMEKYNFDPLTERPLQGRYVWTRMG